uniref:UL36 n=1 Tax=Panagrellus redivivus TaxID=6233 RepID=A0A7E4USZ2_PANRE
MGVGSSANKGEASRSRYSSWGSSIDEAFCGDDAICGDYPSDDLEGFPLFDAAASKRASVVTNPFIEATPRQKPQLRRALSEGEASVRRAYTTDYSDNSDDPDTDDDFPEGPTHIRRTRSAVDLGGYPDQDDFPNRPTIAPVVPIGYGDNAPVRQKRLRKKAPKRKEAINGRRPFSPSQLSDGAVIAAAPIPAGKPSKRDRRRSLPNRTQPPLPYDTDDDFFEPAPMPMAAAAPRRTKKKQKPVPAYQSYASPITNEPSDFYLPSQVPPAQPTSNYYSQPALKPITKKTKYSKEPNYKVPQTRPKNVNAPVPVYTGQPTSYDPIIQSAPPVRRGRRIKPPVGNTQNAAPVPFIVGGRNRETRTPYLTSNDI